MREIAVMELFQDKVITHVVLQIGKARREYYRKLSYDYAKMPVHRESCHAAENILMTKDKNFLVINLSNYDGLEMIPIHCVQTIRWREVEDE